MNLVHAAVVKNIKIVAVKKYKYVKGRVVLPFFNSIQSKNSKSIDLLFFI